MAREFSVIYVRDESAEGGVISHHIATSFLLILLTFWFKICYTICMSKYIHARTCVYNINYHIVLCVKYRRKVLSQKISARLYEILKNVGIEKGFTVVEVRVGEQDHVHCFVSAPPKLSITDIETDKHFIPTPAKYKSKFPFLKEVDSLALVNVQLDLKDAFTQFFKDNKHFGHPDFKSKKKSKKTYTTNCQYNGDSQTVRLLHRGIQLPKLGVVKAKIHRQPMQGWKLKAATISQSKSGKYYCSLLYEFVVDQPKEILPEQDTTIGLDYSSPLFYVDYTGKSPGRPRWFRESEDKLALYQRRLSHMKKGSQNYKRQLHRIQVLHEHIANQRKDFAHQESRRIANAYDAVCVEDINLRGMAKGLKLGKSTNDNGFGMFREFLEYKLHAQGKHLIYLDKWYPSSKTCHYCGYLNSELTLNDREWIWPGCGRKILRDQNAALNIRDAGIIQFYASHV